MLWRVFSNIIALVRVYSGTRRVPNFLTFYLEGQKITIPEEECYEEKFVAFNINEQNYLVSVRHQGIPRP